MNYRLIFFILLFSISYQLLSRNFLSSHYELSTYNEKESNYPNSVLESFYDNEYSSDTSLLKSLSKALVVNTSAYTPTQLVQNILSSGCITTSNIVYTGSLQAIGYFSNATPGLDFASGVILSTGKVTDAAGPNLNNGTSTSFGLVGSTLLNAILGAGRTTQDAAILEFDFVPSANTLELQYVFASEEYPEFAPPNLPTRNDIVAILISGGPETYNNTNIALVPASTSPVSVNTINPALNAAYYINNLNGPNLQYDGLTKTMRARANVTPCSTYHIRIIIADADNDEFDSAVFLKANSFSSGMPYSARTYNASNNTLPIMRGCSHYIEFTRDGSMPLDVDIPISFSISGTAVAGVDYTNIPTSAVIPSGSLTTRINFDALNTGATTDATIILNYLNGCPCGSLATQHTITLVPAMSITGTLTNNGPVCSGSPVNLELTLSTNDLTNVRILWQTGETDVLQTTVSPNTTRNYSVRIIYPCDTLILTTHVQVIPLPNANAGANFIVPGLSGVLNASLEAGNMGNWTLVSGPGTATIGSPTSPNSVVSVNNFGDYTFLWTETTNTTPVCSSSSQVVASFNHIPVASFTISDFSCFKDTAIVTFTGEVLTTSTIEYNWDFRGATVVSGTGAGPYSLIFQQSGNYNITLDLVENGLTAHHEASLYVPPPFNVGLTVIDDPCFESCRGYARLNVTGATPPYRYRWGSSTWEFRNICAGRYGLKIIDDNGCEYVDSFNISQPNVLAIDTSYNHVDCFENYTGNANIVTTGGTEPYTYVWSDGFNGANHTNIPAATYQVTVVDDHNCMVSTRFVIRQPSLLQVSTNGNFSICEDQTINISAQESGGTGPYTFYWNNEDGTGFNAGVSSFDITPLRDMRYTVYVVDAHNCVSNRATSNIAVSPKLHIDIALTDNSCNNSCDGVANFDIRGGIPPYNYSWGGNIPYMDNLCSGLYNIRVIDKVGCLLDTIFVISQPTPLVIRVEAHDAKCNYTNDGYSEVVAIGGTPPYTYLWSNNTQTSRMIAPAGNYSVTVKDDNKCKAYGTATIKSPQKLIVVEPLYDPTICLGQTATVIGQASGGTQPYHFYWNNNEGSENYEHQFMTSPIATTTYHLTVTDSNGCTVSGHDVTVNVNPPLSIDNIVNSIEHVCLGNGINIELDISGGNGGPYFVTNQNGEIITTPYIYYPTTTTNLIFTISDDCGTPQVKDSIMIYVHDLPTVDFSSNIIEACPNKEIKFESLDTILNNSYTWDFGDNVFAFVKKPVHSYKEEGEYNVKLTIKDKFGCKNSLTKTKLVKIFPKPFAHFICEPEVTNILSPQISFINNSSEALYYFWYYGDGDSTINFKNPKHFFKHIGEYDILLVAENKFGCVDTARRTVIVKDSYSLYAPEAFTPNGDGVNDCFRLCGKGIDSKTFSLIIYDRWGEIIFTTTTINMDSACDICGNGAWDGTKHSRATGDKYLPVGQYYWYATFKDFDAVGYEISGKVNLIR